jgi:hypothetical protein
MHLLQDMAVPAHVRNDFLSHMIFAGISISWPINWFLNPFETYVKNNPALLSVISEIPRFTITSATVTDFSECL